MRAQRGGAARRISGALALLIALTCTSQAEESLPQAIDRAGNAVNKKLGEVFGTTPPPRTKPRKPAQAASKPADKPEAKPVTAAANAPATTVLESPRKETGQSAIPLPQPRPFPRNVPMPAAAPAVVTSVAVTSAPLTALPASRPAAAAAATSPAPPPREESAGFATAALNAGQPVIPLGSSIAPPAKATPVTPVILPPVAAPAEPPKPQTKQRVAMIVPLPPPRPSLTTPAALTPMAEPLKEEAAPPSAATPATAPASSACTELIAGDVAVFAPTEPPDAKGACGIERPVRLAAVRMKNGRLVSLEPAALLRCDMAVAVTNWLREDVDPAVATLGAPLDKVMVAASYDCRPRNRVAGAKMSEHGRGNAMDTRGYRLENGREYLIGGKDDKAMPDAFQTLLKTSACEHFKTILGPGSDGYHEEHLHVDLAPRRSSAALCRWAIKEKPAP